MRKVGMKIFKIKITLHQIVERLSKLFGRFKIIFRFPHIWTCVIILGISMVSILISLYLNCIDEDFWSSIFANLFAGLITGFVICLISSIKQTSIIKMKEKKAWLEDLSKMIRQYLSDHRELLSMNFEKFEGDEETFKFIYDTGSHANWVNEEIIQSSFSKILSFDSIKYCKKILGYDALAMCDEYERLHQNVYMIDMEYPSAQMIQKYFENVDQALWKLHSEVLRAISDLEIRLSEIQKIII